VADHEEEVIDDSTKNLESEDSDDELEQQTPEDVKCTKYDEHVYYMKVELQRNRRQQKKDHSERLQKAVKKEIERSKNKNKNRRRSRGH